MQCIETHAADPDDHHRVTRSYAGSVEHGAGAGDDSAPEERGNGHRERRIDPHDLPLAHQRAFHEHRRVGELIHRNTGHAKRRIDHPETLSTASGQTRRARRTQAARTQRVEHDVIANRNRRHARPDGLDHAGAFVAEHDR